MSMLYQGEPYETLFFCLVGFFASQKQPNTGNFLWFHLTEVSFELHEVNGMEKGETEGRETRQGEIVIISV